MASLMKKLCDTMPLAGVMGALGSLKSATVGKLSRHLRSHVKLSPIQVSCGRPGAVHLKDGTPLWGYQVPADPTRIERVTCRVPDDSYNNYLVLDSLEWGYAPQDAPADFRPAVRVALDAQTIIDLPLVEAARLMTFTTKDGQNSEDAHSLWPLKAMHDPSVVHVFAYDITPGAGTLVALKDSEHPDAKKVRKLLDRLQEINDADPEDDREVEDFLFDDDMWEEDYSAAAPAGTVPEDVSLSFAPIRILVATSLTVCRERDDFQPGRPAGVGRLYPHVMVVANADLLRVDAGVRLVRPGSMTLLDASSCGCGEMLSDIGSFLVTDSNADAMMFPNEPLAGAPSPIWANLFNYYVTDPFRDPSLSGKLIPAVSPLKTTPRDVQGFVERDCSDLPFSSVNGKRVTKLERQGQFDNIHVAPRMVVKDKIDLVASDGVTVPFTTVEDWKMDSVTMAPFCAHDCFHMHWRWTDNENTERATFGWGPKSPYKIVGAPMVPSNQKVGLLLLSEHSFSYLAQAGGARHNEWQPFCHHGAGYALSTGAKIALARKLVPLTDGVSFFRNTASARGPGLVPVVPDWALFYWRLRYAVKAVEKQTANGTEKVLEVVERFSFKDKAAALKL